ncbi:MAG TPA: hypothetical protein VFZ65_14030 [Planctomycetota bacterium]|nr:hypothetical protein [Planctomycetota bacterium]
MSSAHDARPPEDPVARDWLSLQAERWHDPGHEAELLRRLELPARATPAAPDPGRWRLLAAGILLGVTATTATLTAATGWRWLRALFFVRVVDVERGADGEIQSLVLDSEGKRLLLKPIDLDAEQADPARAAVVTVDRRDGGALRLRVLRDGGIGLAPAYVASDPGAQPVPGMNLVLHQISADSFTARFVDAALVLRRHQQGEPPRDIELRPAPGRPHVYTNGTTIVEVLD